MQLITSHGMGREFDYLQRLTKRTFPGGLAENYTYAVGEEENTTTTLISGKTNTLNGTLISDFEYLYDENGNITRIQDDVTNEVVVYYYDELNQLIRASHSSLRMEIYSYDAHGNLLTFNNGITSHTYTYGNNDWKDLLTAVDGVPFFYDELGNPLSYYNGQSYSLNWTEGRKLATITTDGMTTGYLYDANGNRIKKTNSDGSYIIYVNANGVQLGEKHYSEDDELVKTLRYIYDENGSVCGYVSNSADGGGIYHFIKNLQGDVIRVYRLGDNAIVAAYSYDSWGNIISATGEKAKENPFRYRGYYYDVESGFYATGSRYYDPEIGRFISADGKVSGVGGDIRGYNLYAYCFNNPVNMADPDGNWPEFVKTAAKWVTKNVIQPVTKIAKEALSKVNKTYSAGVNVSGTPSIFCFNAQGGVSVDTKGNVAIQGSFSGGVTGGTPSASITAYVAETNAPNINKLEGLGYQLGGSVGVPVGVVPVAGAVDFNIIPDSSTGKNYYGTTRCLGLGIPGAEFHVEWGNTATWNATQFNIFDLIDEFCIDIMEW